MAIVNRALPNRTLSTVQAILVAVFCLFLTNRTVLAQTVNPPDEPVTPVVISDDEVNQLASRMYCPVCENVPLDVCPTQACSQWRELIREKLALGWDDQEIMDFFADQYGDRVLAEPPRRGMNWLVYVLPAFGLVIALIYVGRMFLSANRGKPSSIGRTGPVEDAEAAYLEHIEEELRRHEGG